jgi:hypothetical protein
MEEWKITRDRTGCERPGCPLATAPQHYAVLEFPACVRKDLCDACFQELGSRAATPPVFWRAVNRRAGGKDPVLDLQSLRALFDRLGAVDDERARSLRYFCALLLLRKRVLRIAPARTPEHERADLVVVDSKHRDMEPIALFAPAIDVADLGAIKDELLAAIGEGAPAAAAEE